VLVIIWGKKMIADSAVAAEGLIEDWASLNILSHIPMSLQGSTQSD